MDELVCGKHRLRLDHSILMGVLNVTPDSFSDGGQFVDIKKAIQHAKYMEAAGAEIIDIGGQSTRWSLWRASSNTALASSSSTTLSDRFRYA